MSRTIRMAILAVFVIVVIVAGIAFFNGGGESPQVTGDVGRIVSSSAHVGADLPATRSGEADPAAQESQLSAVGSIAAPEVVERRSPQVLEAVLAKSIEHARPVELVREYSDVWRRLLLWTRIDGGSHGGTITARWYSGRKHSFLQGQYSATVTPGENWVVFWLYHTNHDKVLPAGPARVELYYGEELLKTVNYRIKKAGFFDGLGDAVEQVGDEIGWLVDQKIN